MMMSLIQCWSALSRFMNEILLSNHVFYKLYFRTERIQFRKIMSFFGINDLKGWFQCWSAQFAKSCFIHDDVTDSVLVSTFKIYLQNLVEQPRVLQTLM